MKYNFFYIKQFQETVPEQSKNMETGGYNRKTLILENAEGIEHSAG
jgi:hypothetical protein